MIEPRQYCYGCKYYVTPTRDKPCKTCIVTRLVKGKQVDTYERKNFEPRGDR